jgi:hypothetical protein
VRAADTRAITIRPRLFHRVSTAVAASVAGGAIQCSPRRKTACARVGKTASPSRRGPRRRPVAERRPRRSVDAARGDPPARNLARTGCLSCRLSIDMVRCVIDEDMNLSPGGVGAGIVVGSDDQPLEAVPESREVRLRKIAASSTSSASRRTKPREHRVVARTRQALDSACPQLSPTATQHSSRLNTMLRD